MVTKLKIYEYSYVFRDNVKDKKTERLTSFCEWVSSMTYAMIAMFFVFTFLFRPVQVEGSSMNPTLTNEDWLVVSTVDLNPKNGEIIIVTQPNSLAHNPTIVKRVIAVGGQRVDIDFQTHEVFVDGKLLNETYINEPTALKYDVQFPLFVPEGYLFVMGDNRNDSIDSRSSSIGFINKKYILGKAVRRAFPFGESDIYYNYSEN